MGFDQVTKSIFTHGLPKSAMTMAAAGLVATMGGFVLAAQASAADNATENVAAASSDKPDPGKELFINWSCGSCHALSDADADGHVGPAFDGDPNLTRAFIVNRLTNGQGAMPSFSGLMTEQEIGEVADYVIKAAAKPDSAG
jgi:mono/diheme cytochrome c family protein